METVPSPNGDNGRLPDGRFARGNRGGPGNPHAAAVGAWRAGLSQAVSADDLQAVVGVLVEKAKAGEPWAVKELLDRCLGKSKQLLKVERAAPEDDSVPADYLAFLDTKVSHDGNTDSSANPG